MPPAAEYETPHRSLQHDEALFLRALAPVFDVQGPAPETVRVTVLHADLTASAEICRAMLATRTYPFVSQTRLRGREEGREEGRVETLAAAIFRILNRRGIDVDDESRQRIESCADAAALDAWLDQSVVVAKASDLFA